jgi:hypothetical protein
MHLQRGCAPRVKSRRDEVFDERPRESIDLDRSWKVTFRRTARKPAPLLVPDRLTVKMTVRIFEAAANVTEIHSLEGSLMIEWE